MAPDHKIDADTQWQNLSHTGLVAVAATKNKTRFRNGTLMLPLPIEERGDA